VNSVSNASKFVILLGVSFFLTPFLVQTLGDAAYGFWAVLLSFIGYAGILEIGLQPTVVRLVAQHRGRPDREKTEELITAALLLVAAAGLLAALVTAFVIPPLVPRLAKGMHGFEGLRIVFALIAIDIVISYLNYLFAGVLFGWQLYHAKNLIDVATFLLNAVILVAFLSRGGLVLLAASKAGTDLVRLVVTIALCRHTLPEIRLAFGRISRGSFGELLAFGGKLFASTTSARISDCARPLIISSQLSVTATAFFTIPVRIVDYFRQISWALSVGFMPLFSELDGRKESAFIRSIYLCYSRYLLTLTLPIVALIFVYGHDFIRVWIGPEYAERGHDALYLLAAAVLVQGLQPLIWRLFIGVGRLNLLVVTSASAALLTVVLGFLLVGPMGIAGVALSMLVTAGMTQVIFFWHSSRYLQISVVALFREIHARPLLIGTVYFALASVIARLLGTDSYGMMAVGVLLSLPVYAAMAFISLFASERRKLLGMLRARVYGRKKPGD
jgi:O-antigen/teichoic acid export membrane protein